MPEGGEGEGEEKEEEEEEEEEEEVEALHNLGGKVLAAPASKSVEHG